MEHFTKKEINLFKKLNTPQKVQDFLQSIPINFEHDKKDTAKSPLYVIRHNSAHCIEGAVLGAYILSTNGYKPLLMHLKTTHGDLDHAIAPFKQNGYWGALAKTNHAVLGYRDPVYKTIRELAMSYFHEYFLNNGKKTLVGYTQPINLNSFENDWVYTNENLWGIDEALSTAKHYDIAPKQNMQNLRKVDKVVIEAGNVVQFLDK